MFISIRLASMADLSRKGVREDCDLAEIDARRERAYLPPWDTPPQRGASIWKGRLT
jgi:hypothetical protein